MPTTNPRPVFVPTPTATDPYLDPRLQSIWALDDGSYLTLFGLHNDAGLLLAAVLDPDVASISADNGSLVLTKTVTTDQVEAWSEQLGKIAAARRAWEWNSGVPCPRHGKSTALAADSTDTDRNWVCPVDGCGFNQWLHRCTSR